MPGTPETENLRLVPHAPEHLRALIRGPELYEAASGMTPATGLRDFIVSPDVSLEWLAALASASEPDPWRYGFAVLHRTSGMVIGSAGFAGAPDAKNMVEIAYGNGGGPSANRLRASRSARPDRVCAHPSESESLYPDPGEMRFSPRG